MVARWINLVLLLSFAISIIPHYFDNVTMKPLLFPSGQIGRLAIGRLRVRIRGGAKPNT